MRRLLLPLCLFLLFPSQVLSVEPVRVGVLPIVDTLPIYVAQELGYFKESGLTVQIIPCASAAERDQLLAGERLDVVINDAVAIALVNRDRAWILAIRYALLPSKDFPQFYIVASPRSQLRSVSDLKGTPIGVSEATIIQYVTERLLERQGLSRLDIRILPVPRIADRLSALIRGELPAATFPDPFGSLAIMQGARVIIDDRMDPFFSGSLYSVRAQFMKEKPQAVRAFLGSIDRAMRRINEDKGRWADLIVEKGLVPAPLRGSYTIPDFPREGVPSRKQWKDVVEWLKAKGLLKRESPYEESVRLEDSR